MPPSLLSTTRTPKPRLSPTSPSLSPPIVSPDPLLLLVPPARLLASASTSAKNDERPLLLAPELLPLLEGSFTTGSCA